MLQFLKDIQHFVTKLASEFSYGTIRKNKWKLSHVGETVY